MNKKETTVTKIRGKDEYWGYWETCDFCGELLLEGVNYCSGCGRKIDRETKNNFQKSRIMSQHE